MPAKGMIGIGDYTKHWPNVADNSLITQNAEQTWQNFHQDPTWQIQTQHQTGI